MYPSSRRLGEAEVPREIVEAMRRYLEALNINPDWSRRELQDAMLEFRFEGKPLLINQLLPMFMYVCERGEVWPR